MPNVLIIEDDDVIAQGMARHLREAGFDAVGVANGETASRLRFEHPDVCVLDLMLPGVDGWRVIEQARGEGIGTPIVVVSARGTEHDRSTRSSSARTTISSSRSRCGSSSPASARPRAAERAPRSRSAATSS